MRCRCGFFLFFFFFFHAAGCLLYSSKRPVWKIVACLYIWENAVPFDFFLPVLQDSSFIDRPSFLPIRLPGLA